MIISMENAQDKIVLGEYLEKRLQDGLNAVAKLHELDDMTEVDILMDCQSRTFRWWPELLLLRMHMMR